MCLYSTLHCCVLLAYEIGRVVEAILILEVAGVAAPAGQVAMTVTTLE